MFDHTERFTQRISYNEFKNSLDEGKLKIINQYENDIIQLFKELEENNFLRKHFEKHQIERMMDFQTEFQNVNSLIHNAYNFSTNYLNVNDNDFQNMINNNLDKIKSMNFAVDNIDHIFRQLINIFCYGIHFNTEYMRINLLILIDFGNETPTLGRSINILTNKIPKLKENNFINFLEEINSIRNNMGHFSYFFKDGIIWLCNKPFVEKPKKLYIDQLMLNSIKINILSISLYLIYNNYFFNKQ